MRVLVALAFVAAVAAAVEVPQVLPELLFEPNQEYLYKYRTAVSLSLPLKATHATGEETYGLLSVVVKEASGTGRSLVLQLLNVTSTLYDKEVEDQTEPVPGVYHQPLPVFESYQTGPVVLKLVDHSVESLEVPVGVPEEVVNLYRGLASVLTLSNPSYKKVPFTKEVPLTLKDDVVVYKVYEDDLVGTCETVYNVLSSPHDEYVLNFTKTKNYHKCVGKTTVFQHVDYEHSGCPHACLKHQPKALSETLEPELSDYVDPYGGGCPTETHLKNDLAESFLTVHYNVSLHQEVGVLEEVKAIDKKVLTSGKQQLVSTSVLHLELLLKTTPFTAVGPLEDVKTYTNLSYVYPKQHYSWHGQLFELEHLSLYGPVDTVEARTAVRGLLDQLAGLLVLDDLEVKDDYADLVSQLLTAVNVLKEYDFELLLQTVVPLENVKVVSEKEYIERKLLLDVLSLAGTDAAAKTVLRLLLEQKLTLVEAVHVLTSLQTSLVKPSTEVLDLLLDLATGGVLEKDRLLYSTAYLTLAKVVSKHCHLYDTTSHVPYGKMLKMNEVDAIKKRPPHLPTYRAMKTYRPRISGRQYQETETEEPQYTGVPVTCTSQDYLKYVQALVQKLNEAKEFHQVTVLVHALTQLQHPEALKALVPVVLGKHHLCQATLPEEEQSESCQYLRLVTLYALRHSVKHHAAELQPLAQTVYFNTDEDYELRNAALVLLMASHPPEPVLARVVLTLQKELNLQVASFTYSTLFAYANATVPCSVPTAVRVKKLLPALWHKKFGVHYSKFNFLSTYSQTDDFGVHAYHSYVQSNKTVIPRALLFGVEFTKGPYVSHLFDVTAVSKGLETLGKYLLRHEGPVTVFAEAFQRVRRQIFDKYETYEPLSQLLDVLEKQFNFDTTTVVDEPKLSLSTSFLGTELYLPVDKYFLGELLSKGAQYVSENWVHPVNMRYLQLRLPYTYRKLVPSVVGLPVALTTRYPTILSVAVKDFKLRYQPHHKTWLPSVLALSTFVQPSVYTSAVSSVVTVTPFTKVVAGVRTLAKTRLTLPYDFAFQYSSVNHTVALTVRPRYTKFFTHHTKSVTYTTPAVLYTPPQRAVMATMSVLYSQAKPFEFKKTFGHEALGLGLHVQGLSSHPDLHVPFSFQRYTKEKGLLGAFVDVLTNPWHVARKWEARVVRSTVHPVDEYKLTFRWKTTLNQTDRTDFVEEVLPAPYQSTKYPTTRYGYPEDLETPIYEEHYKRAVGELPPYFDFYQVLQEVVAATEVTSTPLAHYVTPFLNDVQNTTYGYFVEFVLGALGPLETKVLTGHALLGHTFDKALKLSQLYVNKVNSPYEVKVHSALLKTAVPSPFKSYAVDKKEQSLYFTSVLDVLTEESDTQKYTLQVEVVPTEEQLYGVKTHPSHYAHPSHFSHPKNIKKQMRKSLKFPTLEHTEDYLVPWYYKQCEKDVQEGKELVSAACKKVYLHEHVLNKVLFKVTVPEVVPGLLKNVTHSLLQYAKVLFYNKLVTDYDVETRSTFTHLEGELVFEDHPTGKTTANLTLYTPLEEKLQFVRLNWFKYLKPTVAIGFLDTVAGVLRRSYPTPTCLVSPTYLKTFDNVTVLLKPYLRDDTYVVARHVLDEPDFYVLTEFQGETQLVKLILRNQTLLELTPPRDGKTFEVLVNGTSLYVEPLKSHVLQYTQNYTSQVFLYVTEHQEVGPTLWVTVRDLGLKFAYDGSKLIFKVLSPKYKGRVLGLCGDLDGEYVDELVTPELCVLTEEEDFVQTYSLKGLESTVGLYKCPLGVTLRGVGYPSYPRIQKTFARINPIEVEKEIEIPKLIGTPECVTERRKTIYKDGKVCISTKKVTACQRRCKPVATEKVTLEFVCLNEKHPVAKRLLKDIQGKRNVRLPTDIPTFNEDVEIPTDCVPEV